MPSLSTIKIVSGGQTGADRAALDVARENNIPHGGWCPKGRWAEDGALPSVYNLTETATRRVIVRTRQNVIDSDATVVFTFGPPGGGSRATLAIAEELKRPCFHADLSRPDEPALVHEMKAWVTSIQERRSQAVTPHNPLVLNIAGSRESTAPGIYQRVKKMLSDMIKSTTLVRE
ncbi:MAG: putative molybdenum carrier protein [Lentisphaeria bacterium]